MVQQCDENHDAEPEAVELAIETPKRPREQWSQLDEGEQLMRSVQTNLEFSHPRLQGLLVDTPVTKRQCRRVSFNCVMVRAIESRNESVSIPDEFDSQLEVKQNDGPSLIARLTSDLILGIASRKIDGLSTLLTLLRDSLKAYSWEQNGVQVTHASELEILKSISSRIEMLISRLNEAASVRVLPFRQVCFTARHSPVLQHLLRGVKQGITLVALAERRMAASHKAKGQDCARAPGTRRTCVLTLASWAAQSAKSSGANVGVADAKAVLSGIEH